jgi:type IV pilus assembly protein PilB
MNGIDITKITVAPEILESVPGMLAGRLKILPVKMDDDTLTVAVADPDDISAFDRIESITGREIVPLAVTDNAALEKAIMRYYPATVADSASPSSGAASFFEALVNRALQQKASDIHIDPLKDGGIIKTRIDGRMRLDRELSTEAVTELVSRVKVLAGLDIAEKRAPQDGQISMRLMKDIVDLRVATIPTVYGEHITLRLLTQDDNGELENINTLGMETEHFNFFSRAISAPNGIILLSGPTGSGKTTTLYAALRHLRKDGGRHLVSIEDPVEKPLNGITQIKVDSGRVTFNKALRSVLRHDPDIVMIGEIRDKETADIAVKAALTGHLVLSSLHTNSAAGVLSRLGNLDIPPFMIASTLRLAIAQRLVRRPCGHCRTWREAEPAEKKSFGWEPDEKIKIPKTTGCPFCGGTGYAGRAAIYEMIEVDPDIKSLIMAEADEGIIAETAYSKKNLPSLRADGARKILQGITTIEEVNSVTLQDKS